MGHVRDRESMQERGGGGANMWGREWEERKERRVGKCERCVFCARDS